ncbi:hypothetical protein LY78DRAFT_495121 [Colletotrichum sublineola]|nr:hypothetical protein LY78DRAFT_495121 [Colletotrichum sublineola]
MVAKPGSGSSSYQTSHRIYSTIYVFYCRVLFPWLITLSLQLCSRLLIKAGRTDDTATIGVWTRMISVDQRHPFTTICKAFTTSCICSLLQPQSYCWELTNC